MPASGMASDGPVGTQAAAAPAFRSEPRPIQNYYYGKNQKEGGQQPVNIMHDRRIYRGNTYALQTANAPEDPIEAQKQQEARRRLAAKKRAEQQRAARTPDAVQGRKHMDVQTELYLEELSDKIPEANAGTQTDAFLDRPPSPFYVPQKMGVDVATQVFEGDLFVFDYEVEPLLEVLVGKTLEQALMECMEEAELEMLRKHQLDFEERRNAELAETQRLEEQERRRTEEKERRIAQEKEILKLKQDTAEKVGARSFAQGYLSELLPSVFSKLTEGGFFYNVIERDIETKFNPWCTETVLKNLDNEERTRFLLDDILRNAVTLQRSKAAKVIV